MKSAFDIKSARLDALAIRLNSMDAAEWESTAPRRRIPRRDARPYRW